MTVSFKNCNILVEDARHDSKSTTSPSRQRERTQQPRLNLNSSPSQKEKPRGKDNESTSLAVSSLTESRPSSPSEKSERSVRSARSSSSLNGRKNVSINSRVTIYTVRRRKIKKLTLPRARLTVGWLLVLYLRIHSRQQVNYSSHSFLTVYEIQLLLSRFPLLHFRHACCQLASVRYLNNHPTLTPVLTLYLLLLIPLFRPLLMPSWLLLPITNYFH